MLTIKKEELLHKYGIDLPKGTFTVENTGSTYKINKLLDDTLGCILPGKEHGASVIESRKTCDRLFMILRAASKKEKIYIFITSHDS